MIKKIFSCFVCAFMCLSAVSVVNAEETVDVKGTYSIHVGGYDWGCATDTVTLTLDHSIDNVNADTFKIVEHSEAFDFSKGFEGTIIPKEEERVITKASSNGNEITLELSVNPNVSSPIVWSLVTQYNTYVEGYCLEITLNDTSATSNGKTVSTLTIDNECKGKTTSADVFDLGSYSAKDGVKYDYASFTPETDSDTLVVWLHGLGEGGSEAETIKDRKTDPYITTLANKVTALAGDEFQNTLGGAHILVPQCPTYWMDKDGQQGNFNGGGIQADGTSYYQESLHELIASYKEKVGAKKVVLAGCSNGGYMTLLMGMAYPDEYDAIVPICEAIPDSMISDEQLQGVKDLPMYFIYSKDDTTVDPTLHEIPTINRLKEMGASNLHVSTTDHVIDLSGLYDDENGNPHQYQGHWSWIYFDNNDAKCDECGIKVFDWIAKQVKTVEEETNVPVTDDNKKPSDSSTSSVATGDNSHLGIYATMMLMAAAGYVFLNKKENA
ncbi:MAG: hypothetical protein ACI4SR_01560 [Faecalibacillus sp.]